MATPANHFKLGLFVIVVVAAAIVIALVLGVYGMKKDTASFVTYFDESVQGLDVDSPVKFRGVTVGTVSNIVIAPDHRHIEVTEAIDTDAFASLGFTGEGAAVHPPPELRAQLASASITGGKFVAIDHFDPKTHPPPPLPFPAPERYIPATPSMLKSLEQTLVEAMSKLPGLADAVVATTTRIDRMLAELDGEGIPRRAADTLTHADRALIGLDQTIRRIDRARLTDKAGSTLDELSKAVAKMNRALDRVDGEDGLIASARRAADAIGGLGSGAGPTGRELERTLRDVQAAAESIRVLAEEIERDPEMLLKGRAKSKSIRGGER